MGGSGARPEGPAPQPAHIKGWFGCAALYDAFCLVGNRTDKLIFAPSSPSMHQRSICLAQTSKERYMYLSGSLFRV